jgi:hypothetical protein
VKKPWYCRCPRAASETRASPRSDCPVTTIRPHLPRPLPLYSTIDVHLRLTLHSFPQPSTTSPGNTLLHSDNTRKAIDSLIAMKLLLLLGLLGAILSLGSCDPCDWNGATPDAYRDYTYECPPHRVIQADGHCDLRNSINCNGFCQVKTTFHYETEMPLGGTLARGPGWFGSSDWMRCKYISIG